MRIVKVGFEEIENSSSEIQVDTLRPMIGRRRSAQGQGQGLESGKEHYVGVNRVALHP
jgi:hypothetical protein